jgi:hypothetical protein
MRKATKNSLDCILDCMSGADGGVSFVMFQNFLNTLDAQAEAGDKDATEILKLVHRFATLITLAQQP